MACEGSAISLSKLSGQVFCSARTVQEVERNKEGADRDGVKGEDQECARKRTCKVSSKSGMDACDLSCLRWSTFHSELLLVTAAERHGHAVNHTRLASWQGLRQRMFVAV